MPFWYNRLKGDGPQDDGAPNRGPYSRDLSVGKECPDRIEQRFEEEYESCVNGFDVPAGYGIQGISDAYLNNSQQQEADEVLSTR